MTICPVFSLLAAAPSLAKKVHRVLPRIRSVHSVVAVLLFLSLATLVRAAGTTVSAGATPLTVKKGEVVAVPVTITGVSGLYGFEAQLKFDPAVVRVADANPGKAGVQLLPGDFLALDFLVRNAADNDAGVAEFVLTQLNPSEAKSGAGTLFTVYFEGIAEGKTSVIGFDRLTLSSRDGIKIPATAVNGEIRVSAASGVPAAASATALPTAASPAPSQPATASRTPLPTAAPPALDMDVLTATPPPTPLPTVAQPATATTLPTAPVPAAVGVTSAAATIPTIATQAIVASASATPPLARSPVVQGAPKQPVAVATKTPSLVAAAPILSGTPQRPAAAAAAAPAHSGLLVAGGILFALAAVALAGLVIWLRGRARRP